MEDFARHMKKITIITVSYNDINNLKKTVASISGQLIDDIEYLIIDGGSEDGTKKYLHELDSKVIWISEPDTGIYNAMNKGIRAASGEWIWFVNAGDCLIKGSIQCVLTNLGDSEDCLVGKVLETFEFSGDLYGKEIEIDRKLDNLRKGMIFSHQGLICKKDGLVKVNFFDETLKIAADWDLIIRMWKEKVEFRFIDECICTYDKFGVSYKPHLREVHQIRKKNSLYKYIDCFLFFDVIRVLKRKIAYGIWGDDFKQLYIRRKRYLKLHREVFLL